MHRIIYFLLGVEVGVEQHSKINAKLANKISCFYPQRFAILDT